MQQTKIRYGNLQILSFKITVYRAPSPLPVNHLWLDRSPAMAN